MAPVILRRRLRLSRWTPVTKPAHAFVCLLVVLGLGSAAAQPAPVDATLVTLEANNRALDDVLADLAHQVGCGLIHKGPSKPRLTLSLYKVPFADCMAALADSCSLLVRWEGQVLVVQGLQDALAEAGAQLDQGRVEATLALKAIAQGKQAVYGSSKLRQRLAAALDALLKQRVTALLGGGSLRPDAARALARVAPGTPEMTDTLNQGAVRGYIEEGRLPEAVAVWRQTLKGRDSLVALSAGADLLYALHHLGSPEAAQFWAEQFSVTGAERLLQETWRQRAYSTGLQLARLNIKYAVAARRAQEAQALQTALDTFMASPRVIQVTCAVDRKATVDPACEVKIRRRIEYLSQVYDQHFGIRFALHDFILWNSPADSSFDIQLAGLKYALGGRQPELTVAFILQVIAVNPAVLGASGLHPWTGFGCPHLGAYLLTRDFAFQEKTPTHYTEWRFTSEAVAETLVHEMGHMFGALHVDDQTSVMRPVSQGAHATRFDDLNRRIIMRHKWQDISLGPDSLDEPELLGLVRDYREIARKCSIPNGANEEEARVRLALAKLYSSYADVAREREQLLAVIAIGAPYSVVAEARRLLAPG